MFPAFISNDVIPVTIPAAASGVVDFGQNGLIKCASTGTAGNIVVGTGKGEKRTYPIAVGEVLNVYCTRIYSVAEGTTATGLYFFPIWEAFMPVPRTQLSQTLNDVYDYIDLAATVTTLTVASGSAVALTSGAAANITSMLLPAGKYDIYGTVGFLPAASTSITYMAGGESETSATLGGLGKGFSRTTNAVVPGVVAQEHPIGFQRVTFSVDTTIYLVASATFTVSTMGAYGTLTAIKLKA